MSPNQNLNLAPERISMNFYIVFAALKLQDLHETKT